MLGTTMANQQTVDDGDLPNRLQLYLVVDADFLEFDREEAIAVELVLVGAGRGPAQPG
jgi:hypothetical protein